MLQDGAQSKPTLDPPGLRLQHKRGQWGGGLDALLFFLLHTNIWTLLYTNIWTCYYLSTSHFILHTHYFSLYLTHIFGRTISLMIYFSYFCMWYLFSCFILDIWTHYLSFYFILDIWILNLSFYFTLYFWMHYLFYFPFIFICFDKLKQNMKSEVKSSRRVNQGQSSWLAVAQSIETSTQMICKM